MSLAATKWARRQRTGNGISKALLMYLADLANEKNDFETWISIAAIADETEYGRTSVIKYLNALESSGFIAKTKQGGPGSGTNRYKILVNHEEFAMSPREPAMSPDDIAEQTPMSPDDIHMSPRDIAAMSSRELPMSPRDTPMSPDDIHMSPRDPRTQINTNKHKSTEVSNEKITQADPFADPFADCDIVPIDTGNKTPANFGEWVSLLEPYGYMRHRLANEDMRSVFRSWTEAGYSADEFEVAYDYSAEKLNSAEPPIKYIDRVLESNRRVKPREKSRYKETPKSGQGEWLPKRTQPKK